MSLQLDSEKLKELMQDFYVLTHIRIVIFDDEYNEILAYPEALCDFCKLMRSNEVSLRNCEKSNLNAFNKCKSSGNLLVYKCHAGLIEATAPLKANGIIIGYIMFGQITDILDRTQATQSIYQACANYDILPQKLNAAVKKIKYKSNEQIYAAAKILEACAYYVLLNQMITIGQEKLIHKISQYIDLNINEQITAQTLCKAFHISRTSLYDLTKKHYGIGIGEYIRQKRISQAKNLLQSTDYSVNSIADKVGFSDYSYFSRVFKKLTGFSPNAFRKNINSNK